MWSRKARPPFVVLALIVLTLPVALAVAREAPGDKKPPVPVLLPGEPTLFPPHNIKGGDPGDKEVKAIVLTRFGNAQCTGSFISPRNKDGSYHILTAFHCDPRGGVVKVRMSNQTVIDAMSVAGDPRADIRWLRTTSTKLENVTTATLAKTIPPRGTQVWHRSWGVDRPGNLEKGAVSQPPNQRGQIEYIISVSPGDSGGPFFDAKTGEVYGPACCTTNLSARGRVWCGSPQIAWHLRPGFASRETALAVASAWSDAPHPSLPTFAPVLLWHEDGPDH